MTKDEMEQYKEALRDAENPNQHFGFAQCGGCGRTVALLPDRFTLEKHDCDAEKTCNRMDVV